MNKQRLKISFMALTLLTAVLSSCGKKEIKFFGSKMDQFEATNPEGTKVYLGHAEQWLYWEQDDKIHTVVGSEESDCYLISGENTLDAYFRSENELPSGDGYAFYPETLYQSKIDDNTFNITLPAVHPYRQDQNGTHPDSSFGRGAMPMVCYAEGGFEKEIYFHVVAGVLRIQLYSSTGDKQIESITFTSPSQQLSGSFKAHDVQHNQPWLTSNSTAEADRTITISDINKTIGTGAQKLLTFYLPLPAVGTPSSGNPTPDPIAANSKTQYEIQMKVKLAGSNTYLVKNIRADIHRRNITMMPALDITAFNATTGAANVYLVGSGTKDRPFQIYSYSDLDIVRAAMKNNLTINGQTIRGISDNSPDGPTCFKIVRSDIELGDAWTEGIENFKGYMYFASATATNGGITNNSGVPLFESISSEGRVELVYVKGNQTIAGDAAYSPMCHINNGEMIDCHNKCAVTATTSRGIAGLCAINNGTIIGGANEALLVTNGNVAGVCYTNNGTLQGNFSLSSAIPRGNNIAGICYNNNNKVVDCLVSANVNPVNSTGNWGIIAFNNNSGGIIDNCISTGAIVFTTTGSIGGVCHNNAGIVCGCRNKVTLRGATGSVGGIVAEMTGGEVFNCDSEGDHFIDGTASPDVTIRAQYAGGIVGNLQGGAVNNCYNHCMVQGAVDCGGIAGTIEDGAQINNCWSAMGHDFIGDNLATGGPGTFCFSGNPPDANIGCNIVSRTTFTIVSMVAAQDANPTYVGQTLDVPLNEWVNSHTPSASGKSYYTWSAVQTTTSGQVIFPTFNRGSSTKAARGSKNTRTIKLRNPFKR